MQGRILYSICFGFLAGVLLRSFVFINWYVIWLLSIVGFCVMLVFLLDRNNWGIVGSVFVLAFSLGMFRFAIVDIPAPINVSNSGIIVDAPDIRENNQKLTVLLAPQGLALDSLKARPFSAKILITTDFENSYKYGDEVSFNGEIEKPENFITDQGKEFDYINYLRKDGIYYISSYPDIKVVSIGHGNFIKNTLFSVKEKFLEKVNSFIPNPENLLMAGLILGEKSAFSEDLRQKFVDTGTIHIVALSGYNVTIVAEWIMKLFTFLPFYFGIGAGILAILLFVLMTGASSTAIRAGIMASLALLARATGRNYDVARALILAAIIMVLINPFILVYDVSFQLSFIATIAVIFLSPRIEKHFMWITDKFKLRDIASVTTAAYILVAPFILYKMGTLSLVALPANVLILPFIPWTMLFGFLTGFAGLIYHWLAVPFGYLSYIFLNYELKVIDFFANIPLASIQLPHFPLILTILIYIYFTHRLFGRTIKQFFTEPL